MKVHSFAAASLAAALGSMMACGAPEQGNPESQGTVAQNETTLTISPSGITPLTVTVPSGEAIVFSNHDSVAHDIRAIVAATGNDCRAFQVGSVEPGAHRRVTVTDGAQACELVDRSRPFDPRFQIKLTVVSADGG